MLSVVRPGATDVLCPAPPLVCDFLDNGLRMGNIKVGTVDFGSGITIDTNSGVDCFESFNPRSHRPVSQCI